jgi:ion channel-forming bestrophin family protein
MYVRRRIRALEIWRFSRRNLAYLFAWSTTLTVAELQLQRHGLSLGLPFAPLGTIGVAVAFYLGFKNAQSYDRLWEARKIWGGIVNASRTLANEVLTYVAPPSSPGDARDVHTRLIHRHLAWINALRLQLRRTTMLEREGRSRVPDLGLSPAREGDDHLASLLPDEEAAHVLATANAATHILHLQARELARLCDERALSEFRQVAIMATLRDLYELQGRCERIKNTPFPRQYAYFCTVFVWIFVHVLPFGLLYELQRAATWSMWLAIPLSMLLSWVFTTMDIVGDLSEDPFENYVNDVPMSAICRTIEIDLRQLLSEPQVPPPLQPVNDVLL